jgi:hypothetical protein
VVMIRAPAIWRYYRTIQRAKVGQQLSRFRRTVWLTSALKELPEGKSPGEIRACHTCSKMVTRYGFPLFCILSRILRRSDGAILLSYVFQTPE